LFVTPSKVPARKQQQILSSKNSRAIPENGGHCVTPVRGELPKKRYFKSPCLTRSPSYLRPTSASQQRASPKKNTK